MVHREEEEARVLQRQTKEAISLAIQSRWEEAATVNKSIIEHFPTDVEAYNRLGKALMELGDYAQAKEVYQKALDLSPHNAIARKNLERLAKVGELKPVPKARHKITPHLFVVEIGKTGVVELLEVGSEEIIAKMSAGDEVYLKLKGQTLTVENSEGEYLGKVEPRQGARLAGLMQGGNLYAAAIARVEDSKVQVIIRETYQHPDQVGKPSFPVKEIAGFRPYLRDSILRRELNEETEETEYGEAEEEKEALSKGFSILEEELGEQGNLNEEEE